LTLRESFGSMVTATGTAAPDWTCIVPPAYCISSLTSFEIEDGNGSACMRILMSRLVRWLCLEWNCDESDVGFSGIVAVGDGGDAEEGVLIIEYGVIWKWMVGVGESGVLMARSNSLLRRGCIDSLAQLERSASLSLATEYNEGRGRRLTTKTPAVSVDSFVARVGEVRKFRRLRS
jgi:hypothetical protein